MSQNNARPHNHKRIIRRHYNFNNDKNGYPTEESYISSRNQQNQTHVSYVRKKSGGLICCICDGLAHGYNFDAITCESCKAFFRRNALRTDGKFKCRSNDGQCIVTVSTRKRCKACRLAKCFKKGMRADWILTEEERMNKRQKIEENRRLRQMLYPDGKHADEIVSVEIKNELIEFVDTDDDHDDDHNKNDILSVMVTSKPLSSDDLLKIAQIEHAYNNSIRLTLLPPEIPSYPYTARLDATWEMLNIPANLHMSRIIGYFKLLPEFASLDEYDKIILIKYNTLALSFIHAALLYDPVTDSYHERDTNDCVFSGKDMIQCFSLEHYEQATRCISQLLDASQHDRLLIQILLIIILFSRGSSICTYLDEIEPIGKDTLTLYQKQNIFVDLLWKYCEHKFGFAKTVSIWSKFVTLSIDAHFQAYNVRHKYAKKDTVADQLVPLMKSVMLIV